MLQFPELAVKRTIICFTHHLGPNVSTPTLEEFDSFSIEYVRHVVIDKSGFAENEKRGNYPSFGLQSIPHFLSIGASDILTISLIYHHCAQEKSSVRKHPPTNQGKGSTRVLSVDKVIPIVRKSNKTVRHLRSTFVALT